MKLSGISEHTENLLADALIELTKTVPFNKLSVSFISHQANVHRNTFYYHFEDIKALILWTIHRDFINAPDDTQGFLSTYFSRRDKLLKYAAEILGTSEFMKQMQSELLPLLERYCDSALNSASRDIILESFAGQILTAYLLSDRPAIMINTIFDYVIPELLKHDLTSG